MHLYPKYTQVDAHNEKYLKNTGNPVARILATNVPNIAIRCSDEKDENILYL